MITLPFRPLLMLVLFSQGLAPAWAEKADRSKPMTLESDQPCTVNLLKQTSVCSGNVVISQGTLLIRADRLELRETPDGYQMAQAIGAVGKAATYRQKRDSVDETVEGTALREGGKPPWAGGPWVVGETHPGWKPWMADGKPGKGLGRESAPGQLKDKTSTD